MHIVPSGLSRFDRRLPVTSGVRVAVDSFIAPDAESDEDVCKVNVLKVITKFISKGEGSQGYPASNFRNNKNKCVFNKRTLKVCSSCS